MNTNTIEKTINAVNAEEVANTSRSIRLRYEEALVELDEQSTDSELVCSTADAQPVYDSPYLTNFSAKEYRADNFPVEEAKISALKTKISEAKKANHTYVTYQLELSKLENRIDAAVETSREEHKARAVYAVAAARMGCQSCELFKTCDKVVMLATALSGDERFVYGMVGGVSEQERRNVLRLAEQTGQSVTEVWPEDFSTSELADSNRKVENKINKFLPKR